MKTTTFGLMARIRWALAGLLVAIALLVLVALTTSLGRDLPQTVWVAQYIKGGKGKVDADNAKPQRNPWLAMAGCLWLSGQRAYLATGEPDDVACRHEEGQANQALHMPDAVRLAGATLAYRRESLTDKTVSRQGQQAPQGASLTLTIKPEVQNAALAQAQCVTGDAAVCKQLGINTAHWKTQFEGAGARMAGVVVMDVATGQVEAMTGAHSHCYNADHSSDAPRSQDCPNLPFDPANRAYRLGTHAASEAMPASLDKPLLALAGLADERLRGKLMGSGKAEFLQALGHSNSPYFLNMVFCRDQGFANCGRMAAVRDMAQKLGWNADCSKTTTGGVPKTCGLFNLLYDPQNPPLGNYALLGSYNVLGGRIMPAHTGREAYSAALAAKCALQAKPWEGCRLGGEFINLMSEAYGQGHALATPIGVAQMYANLANSANAAVSKQTPRLVQAHLVQGSDAASNRPQNTITPSHAALVLEGLSGTHHQSDGTAKAACERVNEGKKESAAKLCKHNRWSSKTGTPSFPHGDSLVKRAAECTSRNLSSAKNATCSMLPYKWFVSVIKNSQGVFSKVVVVLAERNWRVDTGMVGTSNVAAELGIRLTQQLESQGAI